MVVQSIMNCVQVLVIGTPKKRDTQIICYTYDSILMKICILCYTVPRRFSIDSNLDMAPDLGFYVHRTAYKYHCESKRYRF